MEEGEFSEAREDLAALETLGIRSKFTVDGAADGPLSAFNRRVRGKFPPQSRNKVRDERSKERASRLERNDRTLRG